MSEIDDLGSELLKAFGNALETRNQKARFFSTGYKPLDRIVSGHYDGGIPSGRIIEIFGPSQTGKTHLATEIMISCQKQGGAAIYMDYERRFVPDFAERRGLELKAPKFIYQLPGTWEEGNANAIAIAEAIRNSKAFEKGAPIVCVVDSVASANPRSKIIGGGSDAAERGKALEFNMNDTTALARATSQTLPVMARFCSELELTMVYLNQVRTSPNVPFGDPTTVPGGKAMSFYADIRIQLGRKMEKDGKEIIGQWITAKTLKAVTRPFQEVEWLLSFQDDGDTLFDKETSIVEYLVEVGLIEQPSKGWIMFNGAKCRKATLVEEAKKSQTVYESLCNLLKD